MKINQNRFRLTKRIVSLILAALLGVSCCATALAAAPGDADGDGKVTIIDATKIQRLLAGLITDGDGMMALRGDSDGSGLDIMDATRIQRRLAGFTDESSIGETRTV